MVLNALSLLAADAPHSKESDDTAAFEFQGQSELEYLDQKEGWKQGDVNLFTIIISGCQWRLTLTPLVESAQETVVADDGTNYYILARGSSGTSLIGKQHMSYSNTGHVIESGKERPKRHGIAPWLLFASKCAMPQSAGVTRELADSFSSGTLPQCSYESHISKEANSFGPAMVSTASIITNQPLRGTLTELEVLNHRVEGGYSVPIAAELRRFDRGDGENAERRLVTLYRVSIQSFKRLEHPPAIVPEISGSTSIIDQRFREKFEYVSETWKTKDAALKALKVGDVGFREPARMRLDNGWRIRVSFLCFMILVGLLVLASMAMTKNRKNKKEKNYDKQ
jgi:hypothetical protein